MNKPLCESCAYREVEWVFSGHAGTQKYCCAFDLANFPNLHKCVSYEPKTEVEE